MQTEITARHTELTDAIGTYARRKLEKLPRYYDRVQRIELVIEPVRIGHQAECIVSVEHHENFVASREHEDLYAAIDLVVDTMARQLKDHKNKVRDDARQTNGTGSTTA